MLQKQQKKIIGNKLSVFKIGKVGIEIQGDTLIIYALFWGGPKKCLIIEMGSNLH